MSEYVPTTVSTLSGMNAELSKVSLALKDKLSRSGLNPNQMEANVDMNSQRIYNLASPVLNHEPLTLGAAAELGGLGITVSKGDAEVVNVQDYPDEDGTFSDASLWKAQQAALAAGIGVLYAGKGTYVMRNNFHLADKLAFKTAGKGLAIFTAEGQDPANFNSPLIGSSGSPVKAVFSAGTSEVVDRGKILASSTTSDLNVNRVSLTIDAESNGFDKRTLFALTDERDYSWGNFVNIRDSNNDTDYAAGSTTNGSDRPYYRKGEICEVRTTAGNDVFLLNNLNDEYNAAHTKVVQFTPHTNYIEGATVVGINSNPVTDIDFVYGFFADKLARSVIRDLEVRDCTDLSCNFYNCYDVQGYGMTVIKPLYSDVSGIEYGLSVGSSQNCHFDGFFWGARHGATVGGADGPMPVVNRFVRIGGYIGGYRSSAADWHGNCQFCEYYGIIQGGINWGGSLCSFKGTITPSYDGIAIISTEPVGIDQDFSGFTVLDTGGRIDAAGLIRIGGNIDGFGTHIQEGGTWNFRDFSIFWDKSTPAGGNIIKLANRGCRYETKINISNITCSSGSKFNWVDISYPAERVGQPAGIPFKEVQINGLNVTDGSLQVSGAENLTIQSTTISDSALKGLTIGACTQKIHLKDVTVKRSGKGGITIEGNSSADRIPQVVLDNVQSYDNNKDGLDTSNLIDAAISVRYVEDLVLRNLFAERSVLGANPVFNEVVFIDFVDKVTIGSDCITRSAGSPTHMGIRDCNEMRGLATLEPIALTDGKYRLGHVYDVDTSGGITAVDIWTPAGKMHGGTVAFIDEVGTFNTGALRIELGTYNTINGLAADKDCTTQYSRVEFRYDDADDELRSVLYV